MSRIIEISLGKTWNNGNFESSRIDLKAEVGINEDYDSCFADLLDKIHILRDKELDYVPASEEPTRRKRR
jgi:hypothetical protein